MFNLIRMPRWFDKKKNAKVNYRVDIESRIWDVTSVY